MLMDLVCLDDSGKGIMSPQPCQAQGRCQHSPALPSPEFPYPWEARTREAWARLATWQGSPELYRCPQLWGNKPAAKDHTGCDVKAGEVAQSQSEEHGEGDGTFSAGDP